MKKSLLLVASMFAMVLLASPAYAKSWIGSDGKTPLKVTDCTLVDTRTEADATHVYTLNPDFTNRLNYQYWQYWYRNARCDELQFHVDHNTTLTRLGEWLESRALARYRDMANSIYEGQTLSTSSHEWFFVQDGVLHRIPDALTGWSWGLLVGDRYSIPDRHNLSFRQLVTIGSPLNFDEGQYATTINSIWKQGLRDYSSLPTRMGDLITGFEKGNPPYWNGIFTACSYTASFSGDPSQNLLDWSWMLRNPGCALAGQ